MDAPPSCLETKLSKVSELSGESHGAGAATTWGEHDELPADDSDETLYLDELDLSTAVRRNTGLSTRGESRSTLWGKGTL